MLARLCNQDIEQTIISYWEKIPTNMKKVFLIVFLINILTYGYAICNFTFTSDSYSQLNHVSPMGYLGRCTLSFLYNNLFHSNFLPFISWIGGISCQISAGLLIARLWGCQRLLTMVLIASIISIFPFLTDCYRFGSALLGYPLANLLAVIAIYHKPLTIRGYLARIILVFLAMTLYQPALPFGALVIVMQCFLLLATRTDSLSRLLNMITSFALPRILILFFGMLAVLIMYKVMLLQNGSENFRFVGDAPHSISGMIDRTALIFSLAWRILVIQRPYSFVSTQYVLLFLLAFSVISAVAANFIRNTFSVAFIKSVLMILMLIISILILFSSIYHFSSTEIRALYPYAVICSGLFLFLCEFSHQWVKNISILLIMYLILNFVAWQNIFFFNTTLINKADVMMASQIASRIQQLPQYSKLIDINGKKKPVKLIVVGLLNPSQSQDMYNNNFVDDSAFIKPWSAVAIFRWIYFPAVYVKNPHTMLRGLAYAKKMPVWPARGSVALHQRLAIVVLNKGKLDAITQQWQQKLSN